MIFLPEALTAKSATIFLQSETHIVIINPEDQNPPWPLPRTWIIYYISHKTAGFNY